MLFLLLDLPISSDFKDSQMHCKDSVVSVDS